MRLGQFVRVLERFVFEPRDVEFVVAIFDLADMKLTKAAFGAGVAALALAVWVIAVAFLELSEVLFRQWALFLGYSWNIGTRVEDLFWFFRVFLSLSESIVGSI